MVFTWRLSDCEKLVWDEIQMPVQSVIRTLVRKRLWRLGLLYPRSCMDKLIRMHTKMHTNGEPCSPSLAIVGFVKEGFRVRDPLLAPNIDDLAPKMLWTISDKPYSCRQNADK